LELTGFGEFEGIELLQKLPLFSGLTFDETGRLAAIIEKVEASEGQILIEQNALGDALFILREGEVKVSRDANNDGVHDETEELGRLKAGDLFGEMSLVDDVLTSARVTATQPSQLLRLPRGEFQKMLEADPVFAVKIYRAFCRTLTDRLRRTNVLLAQEHAHQVGVR
jgi:CRP-like cAMP-binding protein